MGRPPGSLSDSKTSTSHRNSNRKLSSGDENDTSTSGRKSASSEESKTTYGKWVPSQRVYTSPGDTSYQGNSQDSGNQSILQPLPYPKPPFPHFPPLQLPPHIYPNQMHLPVSSAIPVPVSSSSGPPSASSLHSSHHSPSSGESFPSRTNSYVALQVPPILPPALPATSSCMVSVAPAGDGASSHVAGFSPRPEEQWDHWRSPIEVSSLAIHDSLSPRLLLLEMGVWQNLFQLCSLLLILNVMCCLLFFCSISQEGSISLQLNLWGRTINCLQVII